MEDDKKAVSVTIMRQYFAAWLVVTSMDMWQWFTTPEPNPPLGSVDNEVVDDCGQLYGLLLGLIPTLREAIEAQKVEIQNRVHVASNEYDRGEHFVLENSFVLSLSPWDEYYGHGHYRAVEANGEAAILKKTQELQRRALKLILHQFDSVTIRRTLKELEQDNAQ